MATNFETKGKATRVLDIIKGKDKPERIKKPCKFGNVIYSDAEADQRKISIIDGKTNEGEFVAQGSIAYDLVQEQDANATVPAKRKFYDAAVDAGFMPLTYPVDRRVETLLPRFQVTQPESHDFTPQVDGLIRGVATSIFYQHKFKEPLNLLRRNVFVSEQGDNLGAVNLENLDVEGIYTKLLVMECEIHEGKCDRMLEHFQTLDSMIGVRQDISRCDLVRLSHVLTMNGRHYGAFFICHAILLKLPSTGENQWWNFQLAYLLFVEMIFRAITVIDLYFYKELFPTIARFLLRCLKRVLNKVKAMNPEMDAGNETGEPDLNEVKLAICYNALSFCSNIAGFYESSLKSASAGLDCAKDSYENQKPSKNPSSLILAHRQIRVDLLISKAVALDAREEFRDCCVACNTIKEAKQSLEGIKKVYKCKFDQRSKFLLTIEKTLKSKCKHDSQKMNN